jgi:carbonic anhydrase
MPNTRPETPDEILQRLLEGNWRYRSDRLERPNQSAQFRVEAAKGQWPLAAILTCSDSRLLMESIFDCGIGDLFVCRVAGNVTGPNIIGSLEFAVQELKTPLLLVVGHESCGAVKAACDPGREVGHIEGIIRAISPAVESARKLPGDLIENTVRENVRLMVEELRSIDPVLKSYSEKGWIKIQGAYYHMNSGEVELLHI